jgi:hypothetical protein
MANKRAGKRVAFKDRKTGLVIFGIIHMIIGAFCVLFMLFSIVGAIAVTTLGEDAFSTMNIGQMILAGLLYLLLAVWFVWMGVGSILARKWARALILVTSWLWFIGGVIGFIFMLLFLPDIFAPMAMGEEITKEMVVVVQTIVLGFMAFILVVIPGAFVLFYKSRHVKETCEQRDPQVRWTDKAPLSVITVSSLLGVVAISMPFMGFYQWTIPFFGIVLSGIPGAVVVLIYTLLFAYAAWGTYKLQFTAWWFGLVLTIVSAISMGITFSRVSMLEFYEQMNMPSESIEIMKEFGFLQDANLYLPLFWGLMIIGFVGFLIYIKRYFTVSR